MAWQPIHPTHAIERTRVTLGFDQSPPEKLVAKVGRGLAARSAELQLAGPAANNTTLVQPNGLQFNFQGWTFTRSTPDGQLVEVIHLAPNELVYEIGEYGRWELFSERLRSVIGAVVNELFGVLSLRATSLEYLDRFVFAGKPTEARPSELLQPEVVASLSDDVKSGERVWHLHRGWYRETNGRDALVHVNIDAQDGESAGQPARSIAILTRSVFFHQDGLDGVETLYGDLDLLHDVLISEFAKCVQPAARVLVGLE